MTKLNKLMIAALMAANFPLSFPANAVDLRMAIWSANRPSRALQRDRGRLQAEIRT